MPKTRKDGELTLIAAVTGYSAYHVRQVSNGKRQNAAITWAISRLVELQEAMRKQLERDYQEKFGKADEQS